MRRTLAARSLRASFAEPGVPNFRPMETYEAPDRLAVTNPPPYPIGWFHDPILYVGATQYVPAHAKPGFYYSTALPGNVLTGVLAVVRNPLEVALHADHVTADADGFTYEAILPPTWGASGTATGRIKVEGGWVVWSSFTTTIAGRTTTSLVTYDAFDQVSVTAPPARLLLPGTPPNQPPPGY